MAALKAILVACLLAAWVGAAEAQNTAAPPYGTWAGPGITFTLNRDRTYTYQDPAARLSGDWNWLAPTAVGGVLALCYLTPTVTQTFHNCIYFGITWLSDTTIRLTEPTSHKSVTMQRR